ncbi:MAG: hypothetical protein MO846_11935 [Candidatus Devosia symbiotica]|nr:hypothetical protein [Candidatus Devosia symbiotica]
MAKIPAVLSPDLRDRAEATNLHVSRGVTTPSSVDASEIRLAMRNKHKLVVIYLALDSS